MRDRGGARRSRRRRVTRVGQRDQVLGAVPGGLDQVGPGQRDAGPGERSRRSRPARATSSASRPGGRRRACPAGRAGAGRTASSARPAVSSASASSRSAAYVGAGPAPRADPALDRGQRRRRRIARGAERARRCGRGQPSGASSQQPLDAGVDARLAQQDQALEMTDQPVEVGDVAWPSGSRALSRSAIAAARADSSSVHGRVTGDRGQRVREPADPAVHPVPVPFAARSRPASAGSTARPRRTGPGRAPIATPPRRSRGAWRAHGGSCSHADHRRFVCDAPASEST